MVLAIVLHLCLPAGQPTQKLSAAAVGANSEVTLDFTADDAEIRDILAAAALGALVEKGVLSGDLAEQVELVIKAGERTISAQAGLTTMRADVGASSRARTRGTSKLCQPICVRNVAKQNHLLILMKAQRSQLAKFA